MMLHAHCESCVSRHCNVRGNGEDCCPVIPCEQGCSARYHQCLQSEHTLLCPEERVACINAVSGCPLVMLRRKLASHLEVCPASVLCCPTEWNRWPMHSKEDGKKMPVPSSSRYIMCGQLDVALAMRDQRMLIQTLNAPKKTKRIMRNSLTTRYPAAPFSHRGCSVESDVLTSEETSRNVSDDDCDVPWNLGQYPPGLQRSVCSRLIRATKQATESLTVTLDLVSSHLSGNTTTYSSSLVDACQVPDDAECAESMQESAEFKESVPVSCSLCKSHPDHVCSSVPCVTNFRNSCIPPAEVIEPEEPPVILDNQDNSDYKPIDGGTKLHELLGVDINIDCITRYQPKPAEMYTFLCAQVFRRDEFAWHYKNVHVDLQSCFNGWMEQRCPLAHRGCAFSFRRFQPRSYGAHITHSSLNESFGLILSDLPQVDCFTKTSVEPRASCDSYKTNDVVIPPTDGHTDSIPNNVDVGNCNNSSPCAAMETNSLSDVASSAMSFNATDFDYPHENIDVVNDPINDAAKELQKNDVSMSRSLSSHSSHVTDDDNVLVFTSQRAYSPILLCPVLHSQQTTVSTCVNSDDLFIKLPFEVLRHVARHLDSFSLRNLALTSRLLRDVCCSLLNERGIVTTTWQKCKTGQKISWQPVGRVWRFSTAFSPVEQWHFSGDNPVSEHLKVCLFNQELNVHDEPFQVGPPFIAESDNKLKDLLAQRQRDSVSMRLRELGNLQACHAFNNC